MQLTSCSTKVFREFFDDFNNDITSSSSLVPRHPIKAEVIQVADQATTLDPIVETSEVQQMINSHNAHIKDGKILQIKRTVFYTGYLIDHVDTANLLTLIKVPQNAKESDIKFLANNVLITFGPAQSYILDKVGGLSHKQTWQVTGFGVWDNKVWAARITAIPPMSQFHTDSSTPFVLLAHHRNARPGDANRIQNWLPVSADKQYVFQTIVGEKVQLRIEAETEGESEYNSLMPRPNLKRRHSPLSQNPRNGHANDENRRSNGGNRNTNQNRSRGGGGGTRGGGNNNHRGGRGGAGGRAGGGNNRGRGGGQKVYKSLDDVGPGGGQYVTQRGEPSYDDYVLGSDSHNAAFPAVGSGSLPYGK